MNSLSQTVPAAVPGAVPAQSVPTESVPTESVPSESDRSDGLDYRDGTDDGGGQDGTDDGDGGSTPLVGCRDGCWRQDWRRDHS